MRRKFGSLGPWGQGSSLARGIVNDMAGLEAGSEGVATLKEVGEKLRN